MDSTTPDPGLWARFSESVKDSEGFSDTPYKDSKGFWTVGYGHKLGTHQPAPGPFPKKYLEMLFLQDLDYARNQAEILARRRAITVDAVRFTVLIEMCFILGYEGAVHFVHFFAALKTKAWNTACWELRHSSKGEKSPWYKEEPSRVDKLCSRLETGSF